MNCEQCQLELEDLVYGEATPARATTLRAHLADCQPCRSWLSELEREGEVFARFHAETSLEPGPEMWVAVRERMRGELGSQAATPVPGIEHGSVSQRFWQWVMRPAFLRQAAAAVALIVVTAVVTSVLLSRRENGGNQIVVGPRPEQTPAPTSPSPAMPQLTVDLPGVKPSLQEPRLVASTPKLKPVPLSDEQMLRVQVAKTERAYIDTIKMLNRVIAKRKDTLDPGVFSQYETSIALIDQSIDKSRAALRGGVTDPVAGQFLLAAYARKVELMQEIAIQ